MSKKKKENKYNINLLIDFSLSDLFEQFGIYNDWKDDLIRKFGKEFGWNDFISEKAFIKYIDSLHDSDAKDLIDFLVYENIINVPKIEFEINNDDDFIEIKIICNSLERLPFLEINKISGEIIIFSHKPGITKKLKDIGVKMEGNASSKVSHPVFKLK